MDRYTTALQQAAAQVRRTLPLFTDSFPLPCTEQGIYPAGINTDWTTGFFTGECWLAYEATGDEVFREAALRQVDSFAHRLAVNENLDHHDLGFLYTPSCVAAWRLTGSETARRAALEAAERLTKRYQPTGRFLQAWGVLGMALACRFTGKAEYLDKFRATAKFFLERLPEDGVPYWDLIFTEGSEPRDSSAAAIAACGLYEALPLVTEAERPALQAAADRLLDALCTRCAAPAVPGGGVLAHGVYCKASPYNTVKDYGVDECNLWGDYFYMEALVRRTRRWTPYW